MTAMESLERVRWLAPPILLGMAIAGAGGYALWAPAWAALTNGRAGELALGEEVGRLRTQADELPALQRRRDGLAARVAASARVLLPPGEVDALAIRLHGAALRHGVRLAMLRMGEPAIAARDAMDIASPFLALPLSLRAYGSYAGLLAWVADAAAQRGAVTMRRFTLRASGDGTRLTLEAAAVAHLEPEPTQDGARHRPLSRAVNEGGRQEGQLHEGQLHEGQLHEGGHVVADPFATHRLNPSPADGYHVAMVGLLRDNRRRHGIVIDDGRVRSVRVGDALGQRGARVVRIDDDAVAWREPGGEGAGQWIDGAVKLGAPEDR